MGTTNDIGSEQLNDKNNNLNLGSNPDLVNGDNKKSKLENGHSNLDYEEEFSLLNSKLLWDPAKSSISQNTKLKEFQSIIENKFSTKFNSYTEFYYWSCENYTHFWEEFFHFSNIIHSTPYEMVLDKPDGPVDNFPFRWFKGALLNYAENLLKFNDDKVAVYSYGEAFTRIKSITFKELRSKVKQVQGCLRKFGIKKSDIVVGYLPNCIEALVIKLAVVSLGAVWSCASPDFGSNSVIERFKQIEPKIIFSVTSVDYNGKKHDHIGKLNEVLNGIESIEKCVLIPFSQDSLDDFSSVKNSISYEDFLSQYKSESDNEILKFEQVPFNHPLVILFSSGTTGIPKCIVHSHGGTLIQHLKEHLLLGNMSRDDTILYYTTTGWMMYNWLISSLAVGATLVIYDVSPFLPHINVLWDLVDQLGITMFGTSAKWISVIEDKKCVPKQTHKLTTLKLIYSTGSPLKPASFDYVYSSIKSDLVLGSITGGSDIISLFAGHNVTLPVYRGEIQCRHLGMAVQCWNDEGKPVYDECGELVCTKPFPSMPIYFSNDENFKKYRASYFEKYPGVWAHGDFMMISSRTGGVVMLGRSDGTLNPNGVRFGSADIYNTIENTEEIDDSLCIGQKNPHNTTEERVILFLKLKQDYEFNQTLVDKIKTKIRTSLSARHVPNLILPITEIPYTLNGKKVEVPVRKIIEGHDIKPSSSLVNPKCLDLFKNIELLKNW